MRNAVGFAAKKDCTNPLLVDTEESFAACWETKDTTPKPVLIEYRQLSNKLTRVQLIIRKIELAGDNCPAPCSTEIGLSCRVNHRRMILSLPPLLSQTVNARTIALDFVAEFSLANGDNLECSTNGTVAGIPAPITVLQHTVGSGDTKETQRYPAATISRFNTTRKVHSIYAPNHGQILTYQFVEKSGT